MPSVNDFLDHYSEIYSHDSDAETDFDLSDTGLNSENEFFFKCHFWFLNRDFTASEIERSIQKLKNSKSPGFDGIKTKYIKLSKEKILPAYVSQFHLILRSGAITEQWSTDKIKSIY